MHIRDSYAYTPLLEEPGANGKPRSLLLSCDEKKTYEQIAQFSEKDAKVMYKHSDRRC